MERSERKYDIEEEKRRQIAEEILNRGVDGTIEEPGFRDKLLRKEPLRVKYGIDPTMQSAHIGHAAPIRKLKQFQELGHTAVFVIGDYTARIGDPTGRTTARQSLGADEVKANAQKYFDQVYTILDRNKTEVHLQSEWYDPITLEQLMNIMSRTTHARLMNHETFARRVADGNPLGFHEMLYPVLQAYDSVVLKADVELGGADQMFNFALTRDIQKTFEDHPESVILTKYLPGTDGKEKMSKSLGNTIDLLDSPNDMYGKVMSINDELMPVYFELATDMPMSEVRALLAKLDRGEIHPMGLKKILARNITSLYHSLDEVKGAEDSFESIFQSKNIPEDIPVISALSNTDLISILLENGYIKSKGEGRRLIGQNGVSANGEVITNINFIVNEELTVKIGKRNFVKISLK